MQALSLLSQGHLQQILELIGHYTRERARLGNLASGDGAFCFLLKCPFIFRLYYSFKKLLSLGGSGAVRKPLLPVRRIQSRPKNGKLNSPTPQLGSFSFKKLSGFSPFLQAGAVRKTHLPDLGQKPANLREPDPYISNSRYSRDNYRCSVNRRGM